MQGPGSVPARLSEGRRFRESGAGQSPPPYSVPAAGQPSAARGAPAEIMPDV